MQINPMELIEMQRLRAGQSLNDVGPRINQERLVDVGRAFGAMQLPGMHSE
jgi:hypothetical protein